MTDAIFPQCRIDSLRLMNPETVERLLNALLATGGVRRVLLNGPRLPKNIPYGPAAGLPNPHSLKSTIRIGSDDVELQVHVGSVILELFNRDSVPALKAACDDAFRDLPFTYTIKEGRFMKTEASLSDYAKYGPDADKDLLGLVEPSNKTGPVILQGTKC